MRERSSPMGGSRLFGRALLTLTAAWAVVSCAATQASSSSRAPVRPPASYTQADSAAVLSIAVEGIVDAESTLVASGSRPAMMRAYFDAGLRFEAPSYGPWSDAAVRRLRQIERAPRDTIQVTPVAHLGAIVFVGDTGRILESRTKCYPSGFYGGVEVIHTAVRDAYGWRRASPPDARNVDGIC